MPRCPGRPVVSPRLPPFHDTTTALARTVAAYRPTPGLRGAGIGRKVRLCWFEWLMGRQWTSTAILIRANGSALRQAQAAELASTFTGPGRDVHLLQPVSGFQRHSCKGAGRAPRMSLDGWVAMNPGMSRRRLLPELVASGMACLAVLGTCAGCTSDAAAGGSRPAQSPVRWQLLRLP